jgi:hypothetical protein
MKHSISNNFFLQNLAFFNDAALLPRKLLPPFCKVCKTGCAANFGFAQLAKRKSLARSKPATNS